MKKKYLPFLIIGLVILGLFIFISIFPSVFTSYDRKYSFEPNLGCSTSHLLGTNSLGYDIFTELIYGSKDTLVIGLLSSLFTMIIGILIGSLASIKGIIGHIFSFIIDVFILLPNLIILIVLASFLGSSSFNLILLISLFSWVKTAKEVKTKILTIKEEDFIKNCYMYNFSRVHIFVYHIIPNLFDVILSRFLITITACILKESTLSFLGFGDLYYPTWGVMINLAYLRGALVNGNYLYLLSPSICISLVSISFYFISIYIKKRNEIIEDL